ncbi:hypothetical protein F183_A53250 [Bryobacterales bacterium F-183]|nr:hypothetical protein F183_A53250 [Bryobacterales bacterium F-183]
MACGSVFGDNKRFFWNLDGNVGPGCPNKIEDVQLVQLGFHCKANNPKYPITPASKAIYSAVVPGAPYTGGYNDPLSIAIRQFQKERGGPQDGRVSVISGSGMISDKLGFMMVALNNNISDCITNNWPFIDRHSQCPGALKAVVGRSFVFSS